HRGERYAKVAGAIAIHLDADLRLARVVVGIEVGESRILGRLGEHDVPPLRQLFIVAAAEHHLQWDTRATNAQATRCAYVDTHADQAGQTLAQAGSDLLRRLGTFAPVAQVERHVTAVDVAATAEVADAGVEATHGAALHFLQHRI